MKIKISVFLMSLIVFVISAFAAPIKEIILEDKTVIYGSIVALENGIYKIKTKDIGVLSVAEEKIVTIRNKPKGKDISNKDIRDLQLTSTDPSAVNAVIEALKRWMQNNPATMQSIGNLQNDPDFVEVLNDPEIMSAVKSGDINTLMTNPKFIKLLSHPSVKSIGDKVE